MKFLECVIVNPTIKFEKEKIYPFIDMACVSTTFRLPDTIAYKGYDSGVKFENGDTVVARIEPCLQNGKRFYVKNFDKGFGSTEFLVFRPKDEKLDSLYLYYLLNTNYIRQSMINSMTGATGRQRVNNDIFKSLEFELPDIDVQRKIASILSSYDDLIENNQKQIKLLEEAAQRLYKEWFVDLRFPGHEDVEIVDGLPKGWEVNKLGEVIETTSGGTPSRSNNSYYENGTINWIKTKELEDGFIFETEEKISEEALKNSSAKMLSRGNIVLAMYGATIGKLGIIDSDMTCNQACCVFKTETFANGAEYLFCWLLNNREYLISQGKGAAQPNLSQESIKAFNILVPCPKVLSDYSGITNGLFQKKKQLQLNILRLQEARDRLLPKMMSGEIEVRSYEKFKS